ncbi:MAG: PorT family protein [Prevotella sp.]|nr:PorT family protein [Prevotella sp.]
MKRIVLTLVVFTFSLVANAQWRIGGTVGATYNLYSRDNHYMSDWHYQGAWGRVRNIYFGSIGVMGQYDVNDWLGIRADLNWTMKNHRQYRTMVSTDYETQNSYIQLPVMASFSFGGQKIRGFLNAGVYGGYWLISYDYGTLLDQKYRYINDFEGKRDQRFDFGCVGGVGLEWRFKYKNKDWAWQIFETRIYYSTKSIQKDYMKIKDPRYNTTIALQSGLCYFF